MLKKIKKYRRFNLYLNVKKCEFLLLKSNFKLYNIY